MKLHQAVKCQLLCEFYSLLKHFCCIILFVNVSSKFSVAQNIGIGTTSPSARLHIITESVLVPLRLQNNLASGYTGVHFHNQLGSVMGHIGYGNPSAPTFANQFYAGSIAAIPTVLTVADEERMRIEIDGNVGIGTKDLTRAKFITAGTANPNSSTVAIFGLNTGISLQQNWPTIGFNQYRSQPTGFGQALSNGFAASQYFDPINGFMVFDIFGSTNADAQLPTPKRPLVLSSQGFVAIAGASANSELQLPNVIANRKITLWEEANNQYQYFGFGLQPGTLTYNIRGTGDSHKFLSGAGTGSANTLMTIRGDQNVTIGGNSQGAKLGINTLFAQQTSLAVNGGVTFYRGVMTFSASNPNIIVGDRTFISIRNTSTSYVAPIFSNGLADGQLLIVHVDPTSNYFNFQPQPNLALELPIGVTGFSVGPNGSIILIWIINKWVQIGRTQSPTSS